MGADAADSRVLEHLFTVIESRRGSRPETSYTAKLFTDGRQVIAKKCGEEAVEVVIAALAGDNERLALESADLLYHLLVLWAEAGLKPADIWVELAGRQGVSGLAEKAARQSND
jgi:phosphoribosyl-ATP pyrophosphohydrolase